MSARPLISDSITSMSMSMSMSMVFAFLDLTSASSLQLSHRSTCHSRDIDPRLRQR